MYMCSMYKVTLMMLDWLNLNWCIMQLTIHFHKFVKESKALMGGSIIPCFTVSEIVHTLYLKTLATGTILLDQRH